MPPVDEEMLIDVVNDLDEPVRQVRRGDVLQAKENFRVVHAFLFNKNGDLLLQKLGPTRKRHPGFWGSSVAAYLFAGETYEKAIQRRLEQELGVKGADVHPAHKTSMNDSGCKKFIDLFVGHWDGPFRPDPSHIADLEFVPLPDVRRMRDEHLRRFTPTFLHLLNEYLSQQKI